ncbi:MAG TPA: hypothetical protein VGP99_09790 [Tepidisphaeraceae bacterium]|jgi:hypothetical protein|nr:hypothetical protein [Tepidisphaeraceae bacterium]
MQEIPLPTLAYESIGTEPLRRRPRWVYAILIVYALLILGLILLMVIPLAQQRDSLLIPVAVSVAVLMIGQTSLIFVPVRVAGRRPMTRRSLWFPLIGSGLMAGILVFGGGIALWEWLKFTGDASAWAVVGIAGVSWVLWSFVFWRMSASVEPASIASRLHRYLLAGSVLELLIAVPTHIAVRRRQECCAGIATGIGICAGVAVMLLAFGPSIGFLYYKRWKQVRGKKSEFRTENTEDPSP